jgi:hypothetical protein
MIFKKGLVVMGKAIGILVRVKGEWECMIGASIQGKMTSWRKS